MNDRKTNSLNSHENGENSEKMVISILPFFERPIEEIYEHEKEKHLSVLINSFKLWLFVACVCLLLLPLLHYTCAITQWNKRRRRRNNIFEYLMKTIEQTIMASVDIDELAA